MLCVALAGCGVPEPTSTTPIPQPAPTDTPSPRPAPTDTPAPLFTPQPRPDAIYNADLLPDACAYRFDEVVEREWGRELTRTSFSVDGWPKRSSCELRDDEDYLSPVYPSIGVIRVYRPLSAAVVRRRSTGYLIEGTERELIAGTPVYFPFSDSYGFYEVNFFVAHRRHAVLVTLITQRWGYTFGPGSPLAIAMHAIAAGVVAELDR